MNIDKTQKIVAIFFSISIFFQVVFFIFYSQKPDAILEEENLRENNSSTTQQMQTGSISQAEAANTRGDTQAPQEGQIIELEDSRDDSGKTGGGFFSKFESTFDKVREIQPSEGLYDNRLPIQDIPLGLTPEKVKKLVDLPLAKTTWQDNLQLPISKTGFTGIYFNTETSQKETAFTSENIGLSLTRGPSGVLNLEDLGAFFIGNIQIPESGEYEFGINQSWSETRIILDGRVVYNGGGDITNVMLDAGTYLLEVEFINNWHTAELLVTYNKPIGKHTLSQLAERLEPQTGEIWYVGIYEPNVSDFKVPLTIPKTSANVSLVLSSYSPANWVIQNPNNTKIREVVVSSYAPGVSVTGLEKGVPVYIADRIDMLYDIVPSCSNSGPMFYCEGDIYQLKELNVQIQKLFGKELTGFTGEYYGAGGFTLPGNKLDVAGYKKVNAEIQKLEEEKKVAESKKGFSDMFSR